MVALLIHAVLFCFYIMSYIGGGTIIPWAIIPVAAICNVDVFELARRNFLPVVIGLAATTIVAMFLI
ncbi:hypothetical protein J2S17_000717 [Cytobacillus purgationiresistens]|uniref:Citrate transporter n=2 Tax=Cytobacillus purgationiresistens TaxID=863449 RepID=A0ABU0AEI5_9BACI|nr:hypothetical protein [Cytobacillus purgationiresistens]